MTSIHNWALLSFPRKFYTDTDTERKEEEEEEEDEEEEEEQNFVTGLVARLKGCGTNASSSRLTG